MKKILSFVLAVAMLVPCMAVGAEDVKLGVSKVITPNETTTVYRDLLTAETGTVAGTATIPEGFLQEGETANLYIAKYSGEAFKMLEAVSVKQVTSADVGKQLYTEKITVDESDCVKAFLFKGNNLYPLASDYTIAQKQHRFTVDFEADSFVLDASVPAGSGTTNQISASNSIVKNDPEENGTRGKCAYVNATSGGITFNGGLNDSALNLKDGTLSDYYSAKLEFDIYVPEVPVKTAYLRIGMGESPVSQAQLAFTNDGKRVVLYPTRHDTNCAATVSADDIYNKWHKVTVVASPSQTAAEIQVQVYWDDELIVESDGTQKIANATVKHVNRFGFAGDFSAITSAGGSWGYYVDNVKVYA